MEVKFKKLHDDAKIPTRASASSAGYDLYACVAGKVMGIRSHETGMVHTYIALEIPDGYFGMICARSGLATKRGLRPANCVGIIDSDYRGEIKIALHNDSDELQIVYDKDRVAQIIFVPYSEVDLVESMELTDTDRGEGGFGSSGA